jgi:hypothetical protein
MRYNKTRVLPNNEKMTTNNNGVLKKHVGNIGCVKLNNIFFSFCIIRVIIKELRIETLHHKILISQNCNKIYVIIIEQYVHAKYVGFKV